MEIEVHASVHNPPGEHLWQPNVSGLGIMPAHGPGEVLAFSSADLQGRGLKDPLPTLLFTGKCSLPTSKLKWTNGFH